MGNVRQQNRQSRPLRRGLAGREENHMRPQHIPRLHDLRKTHLAPYSNKPIRDFTPTICRRILNQMQSYNQQGKPVGQASISLRRTLHTTLNQIFKNALADRIIPSNPMVAVERPHAKDNEISKSSDREAFSVEQMQKMLSKAADMGAERGAIWWFRLLTGLRQGEILGASWEDYDMKTHLYRVNWKLQPLVRDHGCGDPIDGVYPCGKAKGGLCPRAIWRIPDDYEMTHIKGQWALTRPKSKTGRIVPIVDPLAEVLKLLHKATKNEPNPHGLFFHDSEGNPIDPNDDERGLDDLMRAVGIDPADHTGHETRHSVVSLLAAAGVDFQLIEQIVGHGSIEMVQRYRHPDNSERKNAMKTLDTSLNLAQIEWGQ